MWKKYNEVVESINIIVLIVSEIKLENWLKISLLIILEIIFILEFINNINEVFVVDIFNFCVM